MDLREGVTRVTPKNVAGVPAWTLGRVFVVRKINPKNVQCDAEDGGRGINFPRDLLLEATPENVAAGLGSPIGVPYEPREFFDEGQIVTLTRAYKEYGTDLPLVVTKQNQKYVNVAVLGKSARGLRVPPSGLVKRDMAWLAERLVEMA